jgi:hypothetical protein
MGTFKSSINLSSTDTLPFSLNQSIVSSGATGEFIESGVKHLQIFTQEFFLSGAGILSNKFCGANGAYVFVQSPSTNTNNIKLYGLQQIDEELSEMTFTGIESFATLKPGDSMMIPLSAQQGGIVAATTFGTASLNYYIADRKGAFGESAIFVDTSNTNYRYIIEDATLAEILPSGYPIPYGMSAENSVDLGIVVADYSWQVYNIVNNKGYILMFTDNGNGSHHIWKFINSRGEVAGTVEWTGDYNDYDLDSKGQVIAYQDGGDVIVKHFDGDTLYTHTFDGSDFYVAEDWNYASSNGSFILEVADYNSVSGDEAFILINKDKSYVLSILNYNSNGLYAEDTAVYIYGNFVYLAIYDDNNSWYTKLQIWNTNGILLKNIDISAYQFNSRDFWMYGENKLLTIFNNSGNLADANKDYILQYNGATNILSGVDPITGLLTQSHINNGVYDNRRVYAYDKYPTDSIRNYNYNWSKGNFDAESSAIVYADNMNNSSSRHINSVVSYCDIIYQLKDQTSFTTYKFADNGTKYIRIPSEYGNNGNRITPSSNLIAFTYGPLGVNTGSLNVLAITSTGVATASLAPIMGIGSNGITTYSSSIEVRPVGEYIMYSFINRHNYDYDTTTYVMVKSATVKGSIEMNGDIRGDFYYRYNSLLPYSDVDDKVWYFNTATNKFAEIPNGYNAYDWAEYNESTTTNGVNDGNLILYPYSGDTWGIRILKKGVLSPNVSVPNTDGDYFTKLGSEAVFYAYQDMNDSYKWKINVYDLDLKLVRTVPLLTDNLSNWELVGKRFWARTYNADPLGTPELYSYYLISLDGVAYWTNDNSINPTFNDQYWWEYED